MSVKAFYFIIVLLIFAFFASMNISNVVTVNLGFKTFEAVPVFILALFSFLVGFVLTIPFFISGKRILTTKNEEKPFPKKSEPETTQVDSAVTMNGIQEVELKGEKKSWLQKLKENKKTDDTV